MSWTYAGPANETAKASSDNDGERRGWRVSTSVGEQLLGALVGHEVDAGADGVADYSAVSTTLPHKKLLGPPHVVLTQMIMDSGVKASKTPVLDDHLCGTKGAKLGVTLDDRIGLCATFLRLSENGDLSAHLGQFEGA